MNIRPIKNETDYQAALMEIERLFEATSGTPGSDRLEVLTTLVEAIASRQGATATLMGVTTSQHFSACP